jgi:hypothetical protein
MAGGFDMPPDESQIHEEAEAFRHLQAGRIIIACERLGLGDPRSLSGDRLQQVEREIDDNKGAIDEEIERRGWWPLDQGGEG